MSYKPNSSGHSFVISYSSCYTTATVLEGEMSAVTRDRRSSLAPDPPIRGGRPSRSRGANSSASGHVQDSTSARNSALGADAATGTHGNEQGLSRADRGPCDRRFLRCSLSLSFRLRLPVVPYRHPAHMETPTLDTSTCPKQAEG